MLDDATGLMWFKKANITDLPLTWDSAKEYLRKINKGDLPNYGHSDWRLPSIDDFETLIDKSRFYPAMPEPHPFEGVKNSFYWSSSQGKDIIEYIWVMDMASGNKSFDYASRCSYKYLWPVRSSWVNQELPSGNVLTGGLNERGQLGDGTTEDRVELKEVDRLNDIVKIAAGDQHAIAIGSDGRVRTWGRNAEGQLGNGNTSDSPYPVLVKQLWQVTDVAAGLSHTLALKYDGTVWAWGRNTYGQLGNGTKRSSNKPIQIPDLEDVVDVSAGLHHSLAIKSDGTLWAWGRNEFGQLGIGSTKKEQTSPVRVSVLKGVVDVSASLYHTVALTLDGKVWAWGWNNKGMLGDGTNKERHKPVQVKGLKDIKQVAAGLYHSIALKSDGTVWAWGVNEYGQLGTSSIKVKASDPIMVEGINNVTKIASGMYHSVALLSDGTIYVWGKDLMKKKEKTIPVKLADAERIIDISLGKYFTVVLQEKE